MPRRVALMLDLEWPHKRHAALFAGTQRYAREHGWESIIDEFTDRNLPERPTPLVPYDGVIGRATKRLAEKAQQLRVPVVNVWFSSPVRKQLPGVFPDYPASGRLRAEHLLTRGLRRFAVLVREDHGQKVEAKAFRDRLAEAGFECAAEKHSLHPTRTYAVWQRTQQRMEAWMNQWQLPIGVFVSNEEVGRMVVQLCLQRGWRVPQDVAMVAGWNEETLCENPRPSLTSVELGYDRIGYEAARLLDQLIDEREIDERKKGGKKKGAQKTEAAKHILLPPQGIVVRESTDFYAVDDEVIATALEFIAKNCHRDIGPTDVAEAVSVHLKSLQRRFRTVLDRSIAGDIRRVRIERAKRELAQSTRSIAAIARDVGFGERVRMYEVFRRELSVTPSEYRKQRQVNAEL